MNSARYLPLLLLLTACRHSYEVQQPDYRQFDRYVGSPALRDSLHHNALTPGMPQWIADTLFSRSVKNPPVAVASAGSRQVLRDTEGWGRQVNDPGVKVWLVEYGTGAGTLSVWSRALDFYRANVESRDTLALYWRDSVYAERVACLERRDKLVLQNPLPGVPIDALYPCEVRAVDNPDMPVSYWYQLKLKDSRTLLLPASILYPIIAMELNGEPVSSFRWR